MENKKIKSLMNVGLKELEAEIYLILLREPNITAYKVAKIVRKPKTTVYKALEVMELEGLILSNKAAQPVTFSAVHIKEYLNEKDRKFKAYRKIAEDELKNIEEIPANTGIFEIKMLDQVFSKSIEILDRAEKLVLISAPFLHNNELNTVIRRASERGIQILLHSFSQTQDFPQVDIIQEDISQKFLDSLPYNWLEIFADGQEYLISLLSRDSSQLYKAQWCNDPYTSILTYNANLGSFLLMKAKKLLEEGQSKENIIQFISSSTKAFYKYINMEVIEHLIDN